MSGRFFPVQGMHLGQTGAFSTFNEKALPVGYEGLLGCVIEDSAKMYRLVQFDNGTDNVASTAGGAAHWLTRASWIVTSDYSSNQATVNAVAGGFLGVVTDQYYCFVQMGGVQAVTTDTTAAAGTALIATTTDVTLVAGTTNTKGNQLVYAISYGTNTTTSANAYWVVGNLL